MILSVCRESCSDTDDTDDDSAVGGQGIFSHGAKCLTHQHWVMQVVSAGGFNVHCTQGPEASHNLNMHLPSARVRHLSNNDTQHSMLRYLCLYTVFEALHSQDMKSQPQITRKPKPGIRIRMSCTADSPDAQRASIVYQQAFVHREARVSGGELSDLICDHFGLPRSRASHGKLSELRFAFGHKYVREDGHNFWGTDSRYTPVPSRHDIVLLKGSEFGGRNALCCETVCFLQLSNILALGLGGDDLENFVIVRWLEPHPDSHDRDDQNLPVCPGPLHVNNCLWRYSRTPRLRRVMCSSTGNMSRAFRNQSHMFGNTDTERVLRWNQEKHAYYGLVRADSILSILNMCNTFVPNTSNVVYDTWLQTVNMI